MGPRFQNIEIIFFEQHLCVHFSNINGVTPGLFIALISMIFNYEWSRDSNRYLFQQHLCVHYSMPTYLMESFHVYLLHYDQLYSLIMIIEFQL